MVSQNKLLANILLVILFLGLVGNLLINYKSEYDFESSNFAISFSDSTKGSTDAGEGREPKSLTSGVLSQNGISWILTEIEGLDIIRYYHKIDLLQHFSLIDFSDLNEWRYIENNNLCQSESAFHHLTWNIKIGNQEVNLQYRWDYCYTYAHENLWAFVSAFKRFLINIENDHIIRVIPLKTIIFLSIVSLSILVYSKLRSRYNDIWKD